MNIGEKIKHLRTQNGLTLEELGNRCDLTKGFISQVERDLTSPSITTLVDILESLGTNLKDFFSETTDEKIVFRKEDIFEKEDKELKHVIAWLVPNSQKNLMEPIFLCLEEGGASSEDDPHQGEEFGYVLQGSIYVHLGSSRFKAKKGESFCFKPSVAHRITNAGRNEAKLLWVTSPPSF